MILVTGGAGFIGGHLLDALLDLGESVRVVDNLAAGSETNIPDGVEFIKKDIVSENLLDVFENITSVFHLAADPDVRGSVKNPMKNFQINVFGSLNVLEAARKKDVSNFIFASSGGTVYGDVLEKVDENTLLNPISPYGASKAAFEMYLSAYSESFNMNASVLRLGNVIGPRSDHGVIWDFFWKLKKNPQILKILGNGLQEKSYIHVYDAVDAFLKIWKNMKSFETYNVSNLKTLSVTDLAKIVSKELRVSPTFEYTGESRGWAGDVKKVETSVDKLLGLGWKPKFSQEAAIQNYVRYLVKNYI